MKTTMTKKLFAFIIPIIIGMMFSGHATAQKCNCQWILNPGFETCSANGCGPVSVPYNTVSAAANWMQHGDNSNIAQNVQSSVVSINGGGCSCEGNRMLSITCRSNESGVYQTFNPGNIKKLRVRACVRVWKGYVCLQVAKDGFTLEKGVITAGILNNWTVLEFETTGANLNNQVIIYNQDPNGGKFDVDYVCVEPIN
jgi:hypothetical protein